MDPVSIGIVWLLLAGLVAWIATTKGKNGVTWFVLALMISPLLAGIFALVMKREPAAVLAGQPAQSVPVPNLKTGVADELTKLITLREAGELTPAEFARQRANLMSPSAGVVTQPSAPAWTSAAAVPVQTTASAVPTQPRTHRPIAEQLMILLIAVAVLGAVYLVVAGGKAAVPTTGAGAADYPPAGSIWFGRSYDPATFVLTGRSNSQSASQPVALIGKLLRPTGVEILTVEVLGPNGTVPLGGVTMSSGNDLMAYRIPSLEVAGSYPISIIDSGGNVLASGTLTAK